jgi:hypothetical protein
VTDYRKFFDLTGKTAVAGPVLTGRPTGLTKLAK